MNAKFDAIDVAIARVAAGHPIVVVDDEDRENEGDLIMAAACATPEYVALMVRHTSGILCTPLRHEDARRLNLWPMVADNRAPMSTAFTVSVDYRSGLTTGISAKERCATIRALADPSSTAEDFVRPGHIFPLIAKDGGVLNRTGHTEAAVDLARLAGLPPVGLLAELVNDDGSVQKGAQVAAFAEKHGFPIISIANLIAYRQARESLVRRIAEETIETSIGRALAVGYETTLDRTRHMAVIFGQIGDGRNILTRLQREDVVADIFDHRRSPIAAALQKIAEEGKGVVVYLRQGSDAVVGHGRGDEAPRSSEVQRVQQWHEIGLGAQILRDLGITSIRILGTRQREYVGLSGFGIEIVKTEILERQD
ncbi:MAG TPA: 3,4-dihydroxy-2-butanone-4-phosphate synthase [Alphaproteobacteria bacterium]|nr:3,4-dihydroxy-2-butanone-4-phosphate synthase [Alphaproteobacteria bacterium]